MRRVILCVTSAACCMLGFAGAATAASGWTNFGAIGVINHQPATTPGNEMVFFTVAVTSNPSNPGACTERTGFYFAVATERDKRLFAMLLMAKASGQNVQIYVTANCHLWGHAEMQGLAIQ